MKKTFIYFITGLFFISCSNNNEDILLEKSDKGSKSFTEHELFRQAEVAYPYVAKSDVVLQSGISYQQCADLAILEGDILLSSEQVAEMDDPEYGSVNISPKGAIVTPSKYKWSNGIIPYVFAGNMSSFTQTAAESAMKYWERNANVRFIKRTNQKDYIHFFNGDGSYSYLGKIGGKQDLSLDASWANFGTAVHEIGHALGLIHEQSRHDRDQNIIVKYDNIQKSQHSQFDISKISHTVSVYMGSRFDFNSIMLYGSYNSFAINTNNPTMTKKDGTTWVSQRQYISETDKSAVGYIYGMAPPSGGGIY